MKGKVSGLTGLRANISLCGGNDTRKEGFHKNIHSLGWDVNSDPLDKQREMQITLPWTFLIKNCTKYSYCNCVRRIWVVLSTFIVNVFSFDVTKFSGQMKEIMTDVSCSHSASRNINSGHTNIFISHISALSEERLPCFHFEH